MRILFMGTPDFAVPSLKQLISDGHEVVGVYTQPDKPKNRGMKMLPTPVKVVALENNIPVYQPLSLRKDENVAREIEGLSPDLIVVAAYGQILPKTILDCPKYGCINVHSSLLPKYRGAAPINWAIIDGEVRTGVTIMHMAEGLDTGDIIAQRETEIDPNENVESLHDRLALIGAELLGETVKTIAAGTATRTPQNNDMSCYASMLSRDMSPLDFNKTALQLHNQIRGLVPWPACTADICGINFKIYSSVVSDEQVSDTPGTVLSADKKGIRIACGNGTVLKILEIQAPGKKRMRVADYINGHPLM